MVRIFCWVVCKSKSQNSTVNWLENESSSDEEDCFSINSPLAKTTFTLNNALPMEFLIDSGSSVYTINYNAFKKLETLMSAWRSWCQWPLRNPFSKFIRMVAKLNLFAKKNLFRLYRHKNIRSISCHWRCNIVYSWHSCFWANQVWTNFCTD